MDYYPNPANYARLVSIRDVVYNRYHDCQFYDYCLEAACSWDWDGWTCRACPIFYNEYWIPKPNQREIDHIMSCTRYKKYNLKKPRGPNKSYAKKSLEIIERGGTLYDCCNQLCEVRGRIRLMLRVYARSAGIDKMLSAFIFHFLDHWDNLKGSGRPRKDVLYGNLDSITV